MRKHSFIRILSYQPRLRDAFFAISVTLLSSLMLFPFSATASSDTLDDGLVGWWKMDESSWNGTAGEVKDASGNGNDGVAVNGVATGVGKMGNAGILDGTNDYISVKTSASLKVGGVFTLSAWIKTTAPIDTDYDVWLKRTYTNNSPYEILAKADFSSKYHGYELGMTQKGEIFFSIDGGSSNNLLRETTVFVNDGNWHNVVAVANGVGSTMEIYIDGIVRGSMRQTIEPDYSMDFPLGVGICGAVSPGTWSTERTLEGTLDDLRIYNRPLTADEVFELYRYRDGTLSIHLPPTSSTTLANYTTLDFTAKLSLPKRSQGAPIDNQVNLKLEDGRIIPLKYDDQDDQDRMFLWKGTYRKTNTLSNQPFTFKGTLEFSDCSQIEGSAIAFQLTDQTPGTYTFRNESKDDTFFTKRDFVPELATTIQTQNEGPLTQIKQFFLNLFDRIFHRQTKPTSTTEKSDSFGRKQEDEVLSGAETRKMCKINFSPSKSDDGLLAYWPVSEGTGSIAYDHGPYGKNMIITSTGGVVSWVTENGSTSLNFVADSSDGAHSMQTNNGVLPVGIMTGYTEEIWFNSTSTASPVNGRIIGKLAIGDWTPGFHLGRPKADLDGLDFVVNDNAVNMGPSIFGNNINIADGKWHQLVGSWDGSSLYLYRDGNLMGSSKTNFTRPINGGWDIAVMGRATQWGNNNDIEGKVKEIKIFDRALSPEEVKEHYLRLKP